MSQTAKAAKSALDKFCASNLEALALACRADAKDPKVDAILVPLGIEAFLHSIAFPTKAADVEKLAARLSPLLTALARSGIQSSDRFAHQIEDQLKLARDIIR